MGPPKTGRAISQEAFDELVKENMEDLDMDPTEALQDAIETLTLQGVDLSGIVTCVLGEGGVRDNPVIQCLDRLKELDLESKDRIGDRDVEDQIAVLFDDLNELCRVEGSGNAAVATKNGGLELVCSLCSKIGNGSDRLLVSALKTMEALLHDLQSTEIFRSSAGPSIVVGVLNHGNQNTDILNNGFAVVAAAATGNEVLKQSFMDLKIDEIIMKILTRQSKECIQSLYEAIRVLLTPDDNRVLASEVYGYARRFAKIGIAVALVESMRIGLSPAGLVSASIALKAVAVNDEICKSIAENGGIDAILQSIDSSGEQGNKPVARACCSLLTKVAGSDANKNAIVEKQGMDRLVTLSTRFSDDASVLQEVMSVISVLCLRSPNNATRAIEAGVGDLAIQAMERFPAAQVLQRNSCLMIRNLAARNPEIRTILLNNGVEKIIRKAKESHASCKEAATDALRDLGLDNYNS